MPNGDEGFDEPAFDGAGPDGAAGNEAAGARRDEAISSDREFLGDCREDVPYGEVFYVFVDDKKYLSCTHSPPHMHAV